MRLDSLYITYWSLGDPLCQSQSLPVARALAARGWRMGLITYEQPPWSLSRPEVDRARDTLAAEGIRWTPLRYHKRPRVVSTLLDMAMGLWSSVRLRPRLVHGRGTVPTAIAYGASRIGRNLFFDDADGPLSQEYVDAGIWRGDSWPARGARWLEHRSAARADAVAVLTEARRREIAGLTSRPVDILPCGVDTRLFTPDPGARARLRRDLGLDGVVLVYAGKSGGWYRTDAMLEFAAACSRLFARVSLLVLTNENPDPLQAAARAQGIHLVVRRAAREEMPAYLSAGDAGLSFRAEAPSQRACSPIKNGEYLSCGLPVVSSPGVGDYADLVERLRVGLVVRPLEAPGFEEGARRLRELLGDPSLGSRCREAARREVDLQDVVVPRYVTIYERLLGPSRNR